jgi:hypothetical protein
MSLGERSQCFAGLCHFHLQGSGSTRRMKFYMWSLSLCLTLEDEGTTILCFVRNPSLIVMLPHPKRLGYPIALLRKPQNVLLTRCKMESKSKMQFGFVCGHLKS